MKHLHQISRDVAGISGSGGFKAWKALVTAISAEGAGAANAIDITLQIVDMEGAPIKAQVPIILYAGVNTAGVYTGGTALSAAMSIVSGNAQRLVSYTSTRMALILTDELGGAIVRFTAGAGASERRMVIMSPGGMVVGQSDALVWT